MGVMRGLRYHFIQHRDIRLRPNLDQYYYIYIVCLISKTFFLVYFDCRQSFKVFPPRGLLVSSNFGASSHIKGNSTLCSYAQYIVNGYQLLCDAHT